MTQRTRTRGRALDVHLVRHGQSTWNAVRRIQGQTMHVPLTDLGEQQARRAASQLADCGARAVFSSDQRRAVQTALPIADQLGVPVTLDPDLRERSLGEFEGLRSDTVWSAAYDTWADPSWRPPGGESIDDVCARVTRFLDQLGTRQNHASVVIVTHGDTAAITLGLLRGVPPGALTWAPLDNGEIITVPVPARRMT
jgi:broad specificity phosphatase PhoE